ncbi:MAG TPA: ferritin family protein [Bacteroidales bacterium]|nr:ferritin family protein [Bacteroidales bacterium]
MEIAVRIEENGNAFYNAAAEKLKQSGDIYSLLVELAEKELQHIAIFQKLLASYEPEDYEIAADDASAYVSHLAESHIFGKPEAGVHLAQTVSTAKDALEIALKFENDSIDFYVELEKRAKSDSRRLIRQIIEEEKEHAEEIRHFL